jgi:ABC-type lipoprotein export system ATPase subunit
VSAILERIQITGLQGTSRRFDVLLQDNTLILVGENGSGKTTFLRILFNVLAGRWRSLSLFRFNTIILTINGTEIRIRQSDIQRIVDNKRLGDLQSLPLGVRQTIAELMESGELVENPGALERISSRYNLPFSYLLEVVRAYELNEKTEPQTDTTFESFQNISKHLDAQVLYLPTYRRIERELTSVVEWIDPNDLRRQKQRQQNRVVKNRAYIELVEFGMQDVDESIRTELSSLQKFQSETLLVLTLKHFGEIVSIAYRAEDVQRLANLSDQEIETVLARVDESIVDARQRDEWLRAVYRAKSVTGIPSERDQIICHYFLKILDFNKALQAREQKITDFCKVCSEYIVDKEFYYDSTTFSFTIRPKFELADGESIALSDLSSGEKQVVSLFSHLYLSGKSRYFVLIDEPELSLSVPWQRRFLADIRKGDFCAGLIAVTHSPFIYDNELKRYARSLGEFTSL